MSKPATLPHKRGDTFAWGGPYNLPSGSTWAGRCHVRLPDRVDAAVPAAQVIAVTVTPLTAPEVAALGLTIPAGMAAHMVELRAEATATAQWPASEGEGTALLCDIEFYDLAGVVTSTQTFIVRVTIDATNTNV